MPNVIMLMGLPASGKSTEAAKWVVKGYTHLNRDKLGGNYANMLEVFKKTLADGEHIVLDNIMATPEDRAPFIKAAKDACASIEAHWVSTPADQCSINALHRMYDRYDKVFLTPEDIKAAKIKSPNIFPIVIIFKYKKSFKNPTKKEGFDRVVKLPPSMRSFKGKRKLLSSISTTRSGVLKVVNSNSPSRRAKWKSFLGERNYSNLMRRRAIFS